jgi:hypothetical protein
VNKDTKAAAATKKDGSAAPVAPARLTFSDDIAAVFREVQASGLAGAKSEFESTAQYQARLASWLVKGGTKRYIFAFDRGAEGAFEGYYTFDYNADAELMRLTVENMLAEEPIPLRSTRMVLGTYLGTNALGVKRTVTRMVKNIYYVSLSSSSPLKLFTKDDYGLYLDPARFTWPMDPAAARANKASLSLALVGTIPLPEATEEKGLDEPTIDDPQQVLVYSRTLPFSLEELRVINSRTGATVWASQGSLSPR